MSSVTIRFLKRHPLLAFYVLAYAFTWALGIPLLLSTRELIEFQVPHIVEPIAAAGPFVAAIVVLTAVEGPIATRKLMRSLVHWRVPGRWRAIALLSTPVLLMAALIGANVAAPTADTQALVTLTSPAGLFELIVVGGLIQSLGEEPGWRGYAIPRLRNRFGPMPATLALWPVWLCWHLPFFLSRPAFGWPQWIGFSIGILSAAIWLTLLRDRTDSLLMCVGWHALANICRNIALAVSTAAFLIYNNLILLSALCIATWWIYRARVRRSA